MGASPPDPRSGLLVQERWRALRDGRGYAYAAAFVAVSTPLWWRNLRVYGSPFYSMNGQFLWNDGLPDFAEVLAPCERTPPPRPPRVPGADVGGAPRVAGGDGPRRDRVPPRRTPWRWWRRARGACSTWCGWWSGCSPPSPPSCSFAAGRRASGERTRWCSAPSGLPSSSSTTRSPAPRATSCRSSPPPSSRRWPCASRRTWPRRARLRARRVVATGAALGLALLGACALDPSPTRLDPGFAEAQGWLTDHLQQGDVFAVDARTSFQPRWLLPRAKQIIVSASWKTLPVPEDEMRAYLCEKRVRYVVLQWSLRDERRRDGPEPRPLPLLRPAPARARRIVASPRLPRGDAAGVRGGGVTAAVDYPGDGVPALKALDAGRVRRSLRARNASCPPSASSSPSTTSGTRSARSSGGSAPCPIQQADHPRRRLLEGRHPRHPPRAGRERRPT